MPRSLCLVLAEPRLSARGHCYTVQSFTLNDSSLSVVLSLPRPLNTSRKSNRTHLMKKLNELHYALRDGLMKVCCNTPCDSLVFPEETKPLATQLFMHSDSNLADISMLCNHPWEPMKRQYERIVFIFVDILLNLWRSRKHLVYVCMCASVKRIRKDWVINQYFH